MNALIQSIREQLLDVLQRQIYRTLVSFAHPGRTATYVHHFAMKIVWVLAPNASDKRSYRDHPAFSKASPECTRDFYTGSEVALVHACLCPLRLGLISCNNSVSFVLKCYVHTNAPSSGPGCMSADRLWRGRPPPVAAAVVDHRWLHIHLVAHLRSGPPCRSPLFSQKRACSSICLST